MPNNANQAGGGWYVMPNFAQDPQDNFALVDPAPPPNYIAQLYEGVKPKKKGYNPAPKATQTSSQMSAEYRDLAEQTVKLEGSIRLESEELERVLETIATQVEVVRDIGSQVRMHISTLQAAAIQLERWRLTMPQPGSPGSETGPSEGRSAPAAASQLGQAGQVEVAPGLLLQDQG